MQQKYRVTYDDGTTAEGVQSPAVEVAFERHFKCAITSIQEPSAEQMYWLMWKAVRDGRSFDEWLEHVVDFDLDNGAEKVDPKASPGG
jgi:hypothetical protein